MLKYYVRRYHENSNIFSLAIILHTLASQTAIQNETSEVHSVKAIFFFCWESKNDSVSQFWKLQTKFLWLS